jgi:hypothetical protein
LKPVVNPQGKKQLDFPNEQSPVRENVEKALGIFQAQFPIVSRAYILVEISGKPPETENFIPLPKRWLPTKKIHRSLNFKRAYWVR